MSRIEPKAGFDWAKVKWVLTADGKPAERCSYCDGPIAAESAPLVLYRMTTDWTRSAESAATFCNGCGAEWFGVQSFEETGADLRRRDGTPGEDDPGSAPEGT